MFDGIGQAKIWNMKKKLFPKSGSEPPSAKLNREGQLVTERDALEDLYLETNTERLQPNPVSPEYKDLSDMKEYLFELQYQLAKGRNSKDWTACVSNYSIQIPS